MEKAKKIEEEGDAAEKIRRTSMERLCETRREVAESSSKLSEKKMRSSGGDTTAHLAVKTKGFQAKGRRIKA